MHLKKENINDQQFTIKILRYNQRQNNEFYFSDYSILATPGMTILDALLHIQELQDPTLAFRYSCRGAVCGSCGILINGQANLACRVQLANLPSTNILLEPLPNLPIIKDLIVDMEPFWDAYRKIEPWLHTCVDSQNRENLISKKELEQFSLYTNCILCACCYAACPVIARDDQYLGPAALVKLYRFFRDPREQRDQQQSLLQLNNSQGLWGCDTVFRCRDSCPKEIRPTDVITALRRQFVSSGLIKFFQRIRGINKK